MLINLREMLRMAAEKNVAVGSFNIYNVESLQAVLAGTNGSPVIIAFGEKYDEHMPLEALAALVRSYTATSPQRVVLHLDHTKKIETILRALKAGFTSVMFDGSALPPAENAAKTSEVVKIAHALNVSVEGELGYMNEEDGTGDAGDPASYTRVADAVSFVAASGVDALAIAIGNAHGIYKGEPHLDLTRLSEIAASVDIPLVLHGSSGIPKSLLQDAIRRGIRKININTEVSTTGVKVARELLAKNTDANLRFETVTKAAEQEMAKVVAEYVDWFNLK